MRDTARKVAYLHGVNEEVGVRNLGWRRVLPVCATEKEPEDFVIKFPC